MNTDKIIILPTT